MAKALVLGRYLANELGDKPNHWTIRRYDHYLTLEEAKSTYPPGEFEYVGMVVGDKEAAKAALAEMINRENLTP